MNFMVTRATKGINLNKDEDTNSAVVVDSLDKVLKFINTTGDEVNVIFTLFSNGEKLGEQMTKEEVVVKVEKIEWEKSEKTQPNIEE